MHVTRGCPPRTFPYFIQPGDTLYHLSQRYHTTVSAIMSANPFVDPYHLRIGERLCIPLQPIYPACPEGNYYTIRAGDTLANVAGFFNISLDDLIEANPGIDPYRLQIGQIICIPLAVPPVTCPHRYYVQPGDTFYSIAQRMNLPVEELMRMNPHVRPEALLIGQAICLP